MNTGEQSGESPIVADIEELIAEVGVKEFARLCSYTTAGEYLGVSSTRRALQLLIREIAFGANPQLEAEVIALAVGVILEEGGTQTRIAKKHGVTKAAISKRVLAFVDRTGLPPSEFMKSAKARSTYALTNQPRTA